MSVYPPGFAAQFDAKWGIPTQDAPSVDEEAIFDHFAAWSIFKTPR